ncbi:MAG: DUF983 domain-containing protein [Chitinophagales bacterium]|nr:DUF983 domain-containing protein [Chitinophagales bacterium]
MKKQPSTWYTFIHAKCPRCNHGNLFANKNPYALRNISEMNNRCPICGYNFFPETGFYWGAMYVSYVLTVGFSAISVVVIGLIFHWNLPVLIAGNAVLLALGFPLFFRYARVLWLLLNSSFDPSAFEKFK